MKSWRSFRRESEATSTSSPDTASDAEAPWAAIQVVQSQKGAPVALYVRADQHVRVFWRVREREGEGCVLLVVSVTSSLRAHVCVGSVVFVRSLWR